MKVLHLGKLCLTNEGGIEVFSFGLLGALNKKGDNVYIIKKDLYCSPCAQIKCIQPEGKRCMDLITVDDVVSVINKIFEKNRKE